MGEPKEEIWLLKQICGLTGRIRNDIGAFSKVDLFILKIRKEKQ